MCWLAALTQQSLVPPTRHGGPGTHADRLLADPRAIGNSGVSLSDPRCGSDPVVWHVRGRPAGGWANVRNAKGRILGPPARVFGGGISTETVQICLVPFAFGDRTAAETKNPGNFMPGLFAVAERRVQHLRPPPPDGRSDLPRWFTTRSEHLPWQGRFYNLNTTTTNRC